MSNRQSPGGRVEEPDLRETGQASPPSRRETPQKPAGHSLAVFWLGATLALAAALGLSAGQAQAASARPAASTITITSETQTFVYSSQITFQMRANDTAGTITSALLEIMVPQIGIDHRLNVPVSQPGASISLTYRYDPSSDYLPPYAPITYHWILSDNTQHSLTGADQHFDFADTRFSWYHLARNGITVYWYSQNTAYGQNILNTAVQEATSIEHDLNGSLTAPLRIMVYASNGDLQGGLPANSPNWAGGVALIPFEEALIVVGDEEPYSLQRDLPHELTHLIFHEIAGMNCGGCPLWFDEGMAVYHQLYHESAMQYAFENAVQEDKLLAFNSITERFPDDSDQAEIAYAQSWNYIKYLYGTYGQPKVARLVDALPTTSFASAFQQAFGISPDQMESKWRVSLGLTPGAPSVEATPTPVKTPTSSNQTPGTPGTEDNSLLNMLAILVGLFLVAALVGIVLLLRRRSPAPVPAPGPWAMPGAGTPPPFAPTQQNYQPGYSPLPAPHGIPIDQRYQWQIEQRQALLRAIEDSIATEKRLQVQQADLERQVAMQFAQEQQARAEGAINRAMLALDRRQRMESQLPYLKQQLAQVRMQRMDALNQERQLSAAIDAAFRQQAVLVNQAAPAQAWPQPGSPVPAPRRPVSQE